MFARVALAFALAVAAGSASAQNYPDRPITLIVPYAAGGPSDSIARLIGQSMTTTLGQTVVIENVSGAGGTAGAARVARAQNDGYTLLIHHVALSAGASLYKSLTYDTVNDFAPIGLVNYGPYVLSAKKTLPPKDIAEFLALVKTDGRNISFGTAGNGSGSHLCNIFLEQALGTKVNQVPYRGTGPAMNDLVAGQLDVLCDQTTNSIPHLQSGNIKGYAVTSLARSPQLPNTPTVDESGIKGFEVTVWHALYAPKGTAQPIIEKLNAALEVALKDEKVLKTFEDLGTALFPAGKRGPTDLQRHLEAEVAKWRKVLADAGVPPQ
ncbi:tripartite tricarboxylate transporter family receptor [Variibacter gotjawalensis]|uniref:Tripartite tricarboxylate transporter family receptor n=1 Tax=Variibacter gotjawalensis TaxID=1333996 RepID=A0A0S3PNY9_9BRAD|nr:tripartite tricarboxylate transporter substrate-binding protein [Variibacter gotjawalensis]NIK47918.1 tripartite-type tricarboxylate transporter receptor subunit TctC [Variibacter gotjawalensis]RZS49796.1 tripartite-type tricarboxylate transporter receptor subunit TctC [Variibacter gotjawalensis]BAT57625.1 tripartite tricarboxylate transporter family receptor [Variibacter gotjawalensis]